MVRFLMILREYPHNAVEAHFRGGVWLTP